MAIRNHGLAFRPLQGGVAIYNPNAGGVGTLGLVATSDDVDRWIVSCYHVLGRPAGAAFPDNEAVLQPPRGGPGSVIARTVAARASAVLDCAAALVEVGVTATAAILELPPLARAVAPVVGMRVIKSGAETGVTEGVISAVNNDSVTIVATPGFPPDYDLSSIGDSGAVWVAAASCAPVVLHTSGSAVGAMQAFGVPLLRVLAVLGLREL